MRAFKLGCNVILLRSPAGRLLIDSGSLAHRAAFTRLIRAVKPDALLVTHHHIDHRGNAHVAARCGVPVLAHALDAPYLTGRLFHLPFPLQRPEIGTALVRLHPRVPRTAVRCVHDGEDLLGHTVMHLPGHTRGQVGLLVRGGESVIVADALVSRRGRAHVPLAGYNDDHAQALAALQKIAALDVRTVWCGHGRPLTIQAVRQRALVQREREQTAPDGGETRGHP